MVDPSISPYLDSSLKRIVDYIVVLGLICFGWPIICLGLGILVWVTVGWPIMFTKNERD